MSTGQYLSLMVRGRLSINASAFTPLPEPRSIRLYAASGIVALIILACCLISAISRSTTFLRYGLKRFRFRNPFESAGVRYQRRESEISHTRVLPRTE